MSWADAEKTCEFDLYFVARCKRGEPVYLADGPFLDWSRASDALELTPWPAECKVVKTSMKFTEAE